MSRYFMIQSWVGSHENEPDYNGQQCGERNVRSIEAVPLYDQYGNANVSAFSDEAIAARSGKDKKKPSVPLIDRVLPQQRRVRVLTEQLYELEAEKKAGMDISTYSQLRDILICKRDRAQVLLDKASKVKPNRPESYDDLPQDEAISAYSSSFTNEDVCVYPFEESGVCGSKYGTSAFESVIDELSNENSLKKILQTTCKAVRKIIHYKHKISSYLNELKAI